MIEYTHAHTPRKTLIASVTISATILTALLAVGGPAAAVHSAVTGPVPCGQHDKIVANLKNKYSEFKSSLGIAANGGLVEIYHSKNGSWTILFTRPGGLTCLMSSGEAWQRIDNPFKPIHL